MGYNIKVSGYSKTLRWCRQCPDGLKHWRAPWAAPDPSMGELPSSGLFGKQQRIDSDRRHQVQQGHSQACPRPLLDCGRYPCATHQLSILKWQHYTHYKNRNPVPGDLWKIIFRKQVWGSNPADIDIDIDIHRYLTVIRKFVCPENYMTSVSKCDRVGVAFGYRNGCGRTIAIRWGIKPSNENSCHCIKNARMPCNDHRHRQQLSNKANNQQQAPTSNYTKHQAEHSWT